MYTLNRSLWDFLIASFHDPLADQTTHCSQLLEWPPRFVVLTREWYKMSWMATLHYDGSASSAVFSLLQSWAQRQTTHTSSDIKGMTTQHVGTYLKEHHLMFPQAWSLSPFCLSYFSPALPPSNNIFSLNATARDIWKRSNWAWFLFNNNTFIAEIFILSSPGFVRNVFRHVQLSQG